MSEMAEHPNFPCLHCDPRRGRRHYPHINLSRAETPDSLHHPQDEEDSKVKNCASEGSNQRAGSSVDLARHEAEDLKGMFGPVLVAALNEICIRRPTDPIEYLGHWLLRYQFNKELKLRDIENAMEVVRQQDSDKESSTSTNPTTAMAPEESEVESTEQVEEVFGESESEEYVGEGYDGEEYREAYHQTYYGEGEAYVEHDDENENESTEPEEVIRETTKEEEGETDYPPTSAYFIP